MIRCNENLVSIELHLDLLHQVCRLLRIMLNKQVILLRKMIFRELTRPVILTIYSYMRATSSKGIDLFCIYFSKQSSISMVLFQSYFFHLLPVFTFACFLLSTQYFFRLCFFLRSGDPLQSSCGFEPRIISYFI